MKNKIKLLILSASTLFGLVGVGTTVLNEVDNSYAISTKVDGLEGTRINKEAKYDANIEFGNGLGNEYLSNVKVQYAEGTTDGTGAIRLVAAVKGQVNSSNSVTLPGTYGFHVSYNKGEEVKNYMYDVEYVYHSISETIDGNTTYYTNDYSSYLSSEGRKTVADWAGEANSEYNLFIALKIDNIPAEQLDNIVTVQPYLVTEGETLTSANTRFVTANNAKNVESGYYLQSNSNLYAMSLAEGVYNASLPLEKGETAKLVDTFGNELKSYTSVLKGLYNAKYSNEELKLTTNEVDVVLEAEDGLLDTTKFMQHKEASGKGLAINFNDAGQGLTLFHYSYFEGTYDVQIGYYTGSIGAQHYVYVNGVHQTTAVYNQLTGWAHEVASPAAVTDVYQLTFQKGWNKIELVKDGEAPNYGQWAQVDYVKILGSGQEFDPTIYSKTENLTSFKLEAEQGNTNTGTAPNNAAQSQSSNRYFTGDFDTNGERVVFNFRAPIAGKYELQICYATDGARNANVLLNDSLVETVALELYSSMSWNNFHLNSYKTTLTLSETEVNRIAVENVGGWWCFDYILLTYVGE